MRKALGRYIIADSRICGGKPVFRGARIFVSDVLEQVASGMAWEAIAEEWHKAISRPAIAEAVRLAQEAFEAGQQPLAKTGSKASAFPAR